MAAAWGGRMKDLYWESPKTWASASLTVGAAAAAGAAPSRTSPLPLLVARVARCRPPAPTLPPLTARARAHALPAPCLLVTWLFPAGQDKIMSFEITMKPDEGLYK